MTRTMPEQRPGKSEQDVGTPRDFLDAVEERFGKMHVDLAATKEDAKASIFITPKEDTFTVDWAKRFRGKRCWLNPPFGRMEPWAEKCQMEGAFMRDCRSMSMIFLLTPASIGSNWFRHFVDGYARVFALSPRLTFVGHTQSYPRDLILSVYGDNVEPGFECWRWK